MTERVRDTDELARRAVACPGWKWLGGMRTCDDDDGRSYRVVHERGGTGLALYQTAGRRLRQLHPPIESLLPDLTDPCTLGGLLHLVREAHGNPEAVVANMGGAWCVEPMTALGTASMGHSEAEALVRALEAAGGEG